MSCSALHADYRRFMSLVLAFGVLRGGSVGNAAAPHERLSNHDRVGVAASAHDLAASETDDPTIVIVEPHTVPDCHQSVKPDQRPIFLDGEMLDMKSCASWNHLSQLGGSAGD
jgi:hypothetical protein